MIGRVKRWLSRFKPWVACASTRTSTLTFPCWTKRGATHMLPTLRLLLEHGRPRRRVRQATAVIGKARVNDPSGLIARTGHGEKRWEVTDCGPLTLPSMLAEGWEPYAATPIGSTAKFLYHLRRQYDVTVWDDGGVERASKPTHRMTEHGWEPT